MNKNDTFEEPLDGEIRPNRWAKPIGITIVVVTILLCIFGVAFSRTDLGYAAKNYQKNHDRGVQLGLVYTTEDAQRIYQVPPEENGAALVSKVLSVPQQNHWENEKKLTEASVKAKWDVFQSAVATLEEASKKKHLIFPRDRSNPINIMFPEFSQIRNWVRLLNKMATFSVEHHDPKSAERYLTLSAYLATASDEEGVLIAALVRVGSTIEIETRLREILEAHGRQSEWREVVEATLKRLDKPYDPKRIMQLEHWFGFTAAEMVMKDPVTFGSVMGSSSVPAQLRFAKFIPQFKKANLSRIDEAYGIIVGGLPSDPYDVVTTKKAFEQADQYMSAHGLSYTILSIVAPVFANAGDAMAREVAYRNTLFQAVELLKTGQDPKKGLPLKGRYSLDLDGSPLHLKLVNGVWVVYSIGPDKVDNGGAPIKEQKGDWGVRLPK